MEVVDPSKVDLPGGLTADGGTGGNDEQKMQMLAMMEQVLEPDAMERLNRVKLTRPAVFDQVVMGVMKAAKEGSLREKISDKKLIEMLDKISESSAAAKKVTINRRKLDDEDDDDNDDDLY